MPRTERDNMDWLRKATLGIALLPTALFGLGAGSNQLVLFANHDKFPVMVNEMKTEQWRTSRELAIAEIVAEVNAGKVPAEEVPSAIAEVATLQSEIANGMLDDTHCIMTSKTHLNFLADVFDLKTAIYSIGDFMLMLSEAIAVYAYGAALALFGIVFFKKE
jgi:hypothetical protein